MAGIILEMVKWRSGMIVAIEQAAEQRLAYFVSLALQAVGITAKEQSERLQEQHAKSKARQNFSQFYKYHIRLYRILLKVIELD